MLNLNVGIFGHVDSGKTSLAKALSEVASTAAFDKNPQSKERGITLDLGFSSFYIATPEHLRSKLLNEQIQLTLVDCPGHASLIRTIIGGAQIIDLILLVIDVTKGIQMQTAESLVIGEITCKNMIVILNKMDLLEEQSKDHHLNKLKKRLKQVLSTSHFGEVPIIPISADPKEEQGPFGIDELINQISKSAFIPTRRKDAPLLFAVDHCFGIKGKGTVMTGTVLQGTVTVDNAIDIPMINATKKIKSMQMFRKPVLTASAGDRLGICVTQFEPKLMERGIACAPGLASLVHCAIVTATKVRYFKYQVATKSKFHITIGHETALATITCFTRDEELNGIDQFDLCAKYKFQDNLNEDPDTERQKYLLLEFDKPVLAVNNCLVIGSKLDMDVHGHDCRIAFWGNLVYFSKEKDYRSSFLPYLNVYKLKLKTGVLERIVNENTVIVKNMFKKETNLELFMGFEVEFSTGESGVIECSFGQGGKVKVYCKEGLEQDTLDRFNKNKQQNGNTAKLVSVTLTFKRYIYDLNKKIVQ